ncbi:unnamed protein product [Nippostrongylus brasiliensis]|uniref:Uncharacterized protein n=1 Tax=Nippostrongylus brasiliensis TaxID=27835 RepID=A0A0N4XM61_NIPBR|nr:unnamed protein product [Nippostrongylus brasiliensis]
MTELRSRHPTVVISVKLSPHSFCCPIRVRPQ